MPSTSPDNIYYPDINAAQNQPAYMGTHATSVQTALSLRQRYSFIWANDAARLNQTGMSEGAVAYQTDTKTEYQYENGIWRLATPHAEFTASASVNNAAVTSLGTFSLDVTRSTSTNFVTPVGNGQLSIANPGIYAISSSSAIGAPVTARSFVEASNSTAGQGLQRTSIGVQEDEGSLSVPNVNIFTANSRIQFNVYQQSNATRTVNSRVRITRIG